LGDVNPVDLGAYALTVLNQGQSSKITNISVDIASFRFNQVLLAGYLDPITVAGLTGVVSEYYRSNNGTLTTSVDPSGNYFDVLPTISESDLNFIRAGLPIPAQS
jgi:hypothetical protein